MPDITLEINQAVPIVLNYGYGAVFATLENLLSLLDELPIFDSDENANLGIDINGDSATPVNGWYMKSLNHVEGGGGSPKKML